MADAIAIRSPSNREDENVNEVKGAQPIRIDI